MQEHVFKLTDNELIALRQLIHFAVQHKGMEVAEAAVVITKKLQNGLEQKDE